MDNQQERRIAWLAGMIDADGCIRIGCDKHRTKNLQYIPEISIVSNCSYTVEYLVKLFAELGVGNRVRFHQPKDSQRDKVWNLKTAGFKRVATLLPLVQPYLITKAQEAEVMRRFVGFRLGLSNTKQPYGEFEVQCYEKMKALKKLRNYSSDLILRDLMPDSTFAEDKVQTATKVSEASRSIAT